MKATKDPYTGRLQWPIIEGKHVGWDEYYAFTYAKACLEAGDSWPPAEWDRIKSPSLRMILIKMKLKGTEE
jgi:hypothetical protein